MFHYLHLRAFAHETEDPEKVKQALTRAAQGADVAWEETAVEGSNKNRILILEGEMKSGPAAKRVFEALLRDDPDGFRRVRAEASKRLDEHLNFYLRLDKQEAFQGRTILAQDEDAITLRGKIRSFAAKRGLAPEAHALGELEEFLLGVEGRASTIGRGGENIQGKENSR